MFCRYCNYNLDDGDIYEVLKSLYPDHDTLKMAGYYGWTPENKKSFSKEIIIQFPNQPQIKICPECKGEFPTYMDAPKRYYQYE